MDLVDSPLRITWDLHGPFGAADKAAVTRIARALVSGGVFFVTLEQRPLAHPSANEIIEILSTGGCRVTALCEGSSEELTTVHGDLQVGLLLDVNCFVVDGTLDLRALGRVMEAVRMKGLDPGLSLTPLAGNLHLLPQLLSFCRDREVGRFKLPNIKIDASFRQADAAGLPRPADIDHLRSLLGDDPLALHAGLTLEVHDLFLWELLFPGRNEGRSEYGGCQAANTLGHVDAAGELYPCSSWPESLGSLLRHSLEEIWQSPNRFKVRDEIDAVPPGCRSCRDFSRCFGGCRGLSRTFCRDAGGRDPLCPGPR